MALNDLFSSFNKISGIYVLKQIEAYYLFLSQKNLAMCEKNASRTSSKKFATLLTMVSSSSLITVVDGL